MSNLHELNTVDFPNATNIQINMMPFIFGDRESLPKELHGYIPMIESAKIKRGEKAYLTIHESFVPKGCTQRRPGIHTDGTSASHWGGGGWGGCSQDRGIYLASSDGRCRAWDDYTMNVDGHGAIAGNTEYSDENAVYMNPNVLYWITDRTPHESLPSSEGNYRQFYRLVADEIGVWYAKHSTPNPFGVEPNCPVIFDSKFG